MQFSGVEEVEHLHHDKGVENEGEVPASYSTLIQDILVVMISIGKEQSTASDSSSNDTVVPLRFRTVGEDIAIKGILVFRDDELTKEG